MIYGFYGFDKLKNSTNSDLPKCFTFQSLELSLFSHGLANLSPNFILDYGRHKGHLHNLLELEAEKTRNSMTGAVQSLKKFMEDVAETSRRLGKKTYSVKPHFSANKSSAAWKEND
jgi:hypothetical protein